MQTRTDDLDGTALQLDLWSDAFASLEKEIAAGNRPQLSRELQSLKRRKRALELRLREAAHGATKTDWEDVRKDLEEAIHDFRSLTRGVDDKARRES